MEAEYVDIAASVFSLFFVFILLIQIPSGIGSAWITFFLVLGAGAPVLGIFFSKVALLASRNNWLNMRYHIGRIRDVSLMENDDNGMSSLPTDGFE